MKVKCIYNKGNQLPKKILEEWHQFPTSEFWIEIGSEYDVFGIYQKGNIICYLIDSFDQGKPDWFVAELFEIIDHSIPLDWKVNYFLEEETGTKLIIGFPKLTENQSFLYKLEDREINESYEFRKYLAEYRNRIREQNMD